MTFQTRVLFGGTRYKKCVYGSGTFPYFYTLANLDQILPCDITYITFLNIYVNHTCILALRMDDISNDSLSESFDC